VRQLKALRFRPVRKNSICLLIFHRYGQSFYSYSSFTGTDNFLFLLIFTGTDHFCVLIHLLPVRTIFCSCSFLPVRTNSLFLFISDRYGQTLTSHVTTNCEKHCFSKGRLQLFTANTHTNVTADSSLHVHDCLDMRQTDRQTCRLQSGSQHFCYNQAWATKK
jgi:hypothetical protein